MGTKDPRVDAYIARSADFAKPILTHLRKLIHDNCPSVEETIKWSFPHFNYKGPADRSPHPLQHGLIQTALRVWVLVHGQHE